MNHKLNHMNQIRMNEIKRQILTTSWDLPLIKNDKIKAMKQQKLDELIKELNNIKQEAIA